MREIKFRARFTDHFVYFTLDDLISIDKECNDDEEYAILNHDISTRGQFTGRKDNNSIEIYDGDILEFAGAPGMGDGIATVIWHDTEACWYIENSDIDIYDMLYNVTGYCVVIGNIHEQE